MCGRLWMALRYPQPDPGLTGNQARQRVRSGEWQRLRRGVFLTDPDWETPDLDHFARERIGHAHRAVTAARSHPASVIAYESAAAVVSLPTWGSLSGTVNLLAREMARLEDLRHMAAFAEVARLPGRRRVRAAIDLIDPVRESPLESSSVAYFVRYAVPLPKAQVEIYDERGLFVARVDFLWENPVTGVRVVGEADGQGKYGGSQDLYQEKRREDALRALGFVVIRWGTQDLRDAQLAARIITSLAG